MVRYGVCGGWDLARVEEEDGWMDGWANRDSLRGCVRGGIYIYAPYPWYQSGCYTRAPIYETRVFALQIPVTPRCIITQNHSRVIISLITRSRLPAPMPYPSNRPQFCGESCVQTPGKRDMTWRDETGLSLSVANEWTSKQASNQASKQNVTLPVKYSLVAYSMVRYSHRGQPSMCCSTLRSLHQPRAQNIPFSWCTGIYSFYYPNPYGRIYASLPPPSTTIR